MNYPALSLQKSMLKCRMALQIKVRRLLRAVLMIGVSVFAIVFLYRLTGAGSLNPVSAPAGTMNATEDIYDALVGSGSFDSSAVVASANGNALEISKCIIDIVDGGPGCP
jgi:hypothetical protein